MGEGRERRNAATGLWVVMIVWLCLYLYLGEIERCDFLEIYPFWFSLRMDGTGVPGLLVMCDYWNSVVWEWESAKCTNDHSTKQIYFLISPSLIRDSCTFISLS